MAGRVNWQGMFDASGGVFRLRPNLVRRFYPDAGRLDGSGRFGGSYRKKDGLYVAERWMCSTTLAVNPHPIDGEGLSELADGPPGTRFGALLEALPVRLLGARRHKKHGAQFRVLIKIVDGGVVRPFHFHPTNRAVRANPRNYPGCSFGKEEANYYLEAPKGAVPYTHMGLHPWVTKKQFLAAVRRGGDYLGELSPCILQRYGQGCFVPGGIVHRPGTALVLEVQQPTDAGTLLEDRDAMGCPLTPRQKHAGFETIDDALRDLRFGAQRKEGLLESLRLTPRPTGETIDRGVSEDWVWPPDLSKYFNGKRVRVKRRHAYASADAHVVFVWKGTGQFGPHAVRAGDELFVSAEAAGAGLTVRAEEEDPLEFFVMFAEVV